MRRVYPAPSRPNVARPSSPVRWLKVGLRRPTACFSVLIVFYIGAVLYWEKKLTYDSEPETEQDQTVTDFAEASEIIKAEMRRQDKQDQPPPVLQDQPTPALQDQQPPVLHESTAHHETVHHNRGRDSTTSAGHLEPQAAGKQCKLAQRKERFLIYVLPLPHKFNADCVEKLSTVEDLSYNGVGRAMDDSDDKHFRHTSHYSLEVIFHMRLLASSWVTKELEEASAIYIPYYAGLLATAEQCRNGLTIDEFDTDLINELAKSTGWQQCNGQRHIMALSRSESFFLQGKKCSVKGSDQVQKRSSIRCNDHLKKITFIVPEHASTLLSLRLPTGAMPSVLAPYPSWVHLDTANKQPLAFTDDSRRNILLAGAFDVNVEDSYNNQLRHHLQQQLQTKASSVSSVYFEVNTKSLHNLDWELQLLELMRHTKFFVHPPGDSKINLKYFFDSVLIGCIPVLMMSSPEEMQQVLPFSDVIDYKRLVLHVPTKSIMLEKINIKQHIAKVTAEAVAAFRAYQKEVAHLLQYSLSVDSSEKKPFNDAFHMAMQRVETQIARP